jgi:signal transduction histidine kinase/ligand-binding sensor domain-containing protein
MRHISVRLFCFFILCQVIQSGFAQSFTAINYTVTEGLPSVEVYDIHQDANGFLWFATDNGVVKFDGHEMQKFGTDQGLSDQVVFGFHEDHKGRIWFRTFSGKISYYEKKKIHRYKYNEALSGLTKKSILSSLYVDEADRVWFATYAGIGVWGRIDSIGNVTENVNPDLKDRFEVWYREIEGHPLLGYLWYDRINTMVIEDKVISFHLSDSTCSALRVTPIKWRNKLYFGICRDIFEFTGTSMKKVFTGSGSIISLSKDREDNLWVGYFGHGAEKFSTGDFKKRQTFDFLKELSVTRVLQDHEKGFWISTLDQGVFYVPNFTIGQNILPESLKIRFVSATNDRVCVGTNKNSVLVFNSLGQEQERKSFSRRLFSMFVDRDKNLVVSDAGGTYLFDKNLTPTKKYLPASFTKFNQDPKGNIYTIQSGTGVSKFDSAFNFLSKTRLEFMCRTLWPDESHLYVATRDGLHIYDTAFHLLEEPKELLGHKISNIIKLNDSTLLLTTIGKGFGLFNVKSRKYLSYNTKNKFIANNIYSAVIVDSLVWFGTEKGIVRTNIRSLFSGHPTLDFIARQSGLISNQINHLAYVKENIWAFSDRGFSIIKKDVSNFSSTKPQFQMKDISVENELLEGWESEIVLPHNKNNIQISYGYIAFNNQNIFTRYRLNAESPWSYTTSRTLLFNSLSPGSYVLELESSTDNIHWSKAFTSAALIIQPPLWQTWYFQTAAGILVAMLILLYFRNRIVVYRRHQQKLIQSQIETIEQERTRIAKDLHDSVGTDFSAIKMMVSQVLQKHNEPKSEEIETQFQHTIQEIKTIIYGLSPPGLERYGLIVGVRNYVAKLNGKIPATIEVNAFGPEIKDPKLSLTLFRILQELISNSLRHSDAEKISLHINSFEDLINIVYEDNGKGFAWNVNQNGLGLYNIESRIQSVNGRLKFDSGTFGISYTIDIPLERPL